MSHRLRSRSKSPFATLLTGSLHHEHHFPVRRRLRHRCGLRRLHLLGNQHKGRWPLNPLSKAGGQVSPLEKNPRAGALRAHRPFRFPDSQLPLNCRASSRPSSDPCCCPCSAAVWRSYWPAAERTPAGWPVEVPAWSQAVLRCLAGQPADCGGPLPAAGLGLRPACLPAELRVCLLAAPRAPPADDQMAGRKEWAGVG